MLINVLRGEFDIAMGFAHSLSPARVLFFGSPAVYIMVLCLLLRATMLTVPTTGFCDLPLTVVGTGANASTQNSSYVPLSDQLGFGGLSARHTSCTHPGAPADGEDEGEEHSLGDYLGQELEGVFSFQAERSQQIRTTPAPQNTCGAHGAPVWMDTLGWAGPCSHSDGTTDCSLPSLWEGPVARNLCFQDGSESCSSVLPAMVQRCTHGRYLYRLPKPEATEIYAADAALSATNLTFKNDSVGRPPVPVGAVAGDIRIEHASSAFVGTTSPCEDDDEEETEPAAAPSRNSDQLLVLEVHGTGFVAPSRACEEDEMTQQMTSATAPVEWSWTRIMDRHCVQMPHSHQFSTWRAAADACERQNHCMGISDGGCDDRMPGQWRLCTFVRGGFRRQRDSCVYQKTTTTCSRDPFSNQNASDSKLQTPRRRVVCGPRTTGRSWVMYTAEPRESRFGRAAKMASNPIATASVPDSSWSEAGLPFTSEGFSEHFVCVSYDEAAGWVYDRVVSTGGHALNVSTLPFEPARTDVLLGRVDFGRRVQGSFCTEDTPKTRVPRNSTGGALRYDPWEDSAFVWPLIWFALAVMLICDDPLYWGCRACQTNGPHGLWCV